jgi:hypothetical protein
VLKYPALYEGLSREQKEAIPQALRVWRRYRSEKYLGSAGRRREMNPSTSGMPPWKIKYP